MSTQPRMSVEEYLVWAEGRDGRYELVDGEVVALSPERARHWEIKLATHVALLNALKAKSLDCHVVPDGATVRIDAHSAYEPDAMVYCGGKIAPDSMIVENPVVIVEILSASTGRKDKAQKLVNYFRLPSVQHYLIVDPDQPLIIHHQRHGADILTRIVREGTIKLDPPGLEVGVGEIYGAGM